MGYHCRKVMGNNTAVYQVIQLLLDYLYCLLCPQGPYIRLQVRLVSQFNLWQGGSHLSGSSIVRSLALVRPCLVLNVSKALLGTFPPSCPSPSKHRINKQGQVRINKRERVNVVGAVFRKPFNNHCQLVYFFLLINAIFHNKLISYSLFLSFVVST